MHSLFRHWKHRHHHHREQLWFIVNDIAVELKPHEEIEMAQILRVDEIDNLSIAAVDASGAPITPTFDAPPTWTLVDTAASGATLVAAADGLSAVLTAGAVGTTVSVNLSGVIGGTTFTATLDVSFVASATGVASISIVATPAPKPAVTPTPAPAPGP